MAIKFTGAVLHNIEVYGPIKNRVPVSGWYTASNGRLDLWMSEEEMVKGGNPLPFPPCTSFYSFNWRDVDYYLY